MRPSPFVRAACAGLLSSLLLFVGGCSKDGKPSGSGADKGGSSARGPGSSGTPGWFGPAVPSHLSVEDLARYPAPVPVQTVARAKEIPTFPPQEETRPSATEANTSVKVSLLGVAHSRTLPGLRAPQGQEFVVLTTRWENIHPKAELWQSELEGGANRTMGVGGFARGGGAKKGDRKVLADVAYQVPKMGDHAWLLADGTAFALSPSTPSLLRGAPLNRPFTLRRQGDAAVLRLAYQVPEGTRALALRFFDDANGHLTLPVAGSLDEASGGGAAPKSALAQAKGPNLALAVLGMEDVPRAHDVDAPKGWHFTLVHLAGQGLGPEGAPAPIAQIDPRKYLWVSTTTGRIRYASGGDVGPAGKLRFPPGIYRRLEAVFLVPDGEKLARVSARDGKSVLALALGPAVQEPQALASAKDGEVMAVEVVGLWRGDEQTVVDLVVKNLVAAKGLTLDLQQFSLATEERPAQADAAITRTLVHGPQSPFVVPPGGSARFELGFATSAPPKSLEVDGFTAKLSLPLSTVKASEEEPVRGVSTREAENLVRLAPQVAEEDEAAWAPGEPGETSRVVSSAEGPPAEPAPLPFPDDREPNNGPAQAGVLREEGLANGRFDEASDRDAYAFTLTGAPALWRLEVEGPGVEDLTYQGVSDSSAVTRYAKEGRGDIDDLYLLPGKHFVTVHGGPADGKDGYTVHLVPRGAAPLDWEHEPNDDARRAQPIGLGETRRGHLSAQDDRDLYALSLATVEHVAISLTPPPDGALRFDLGSGRLQATASSDELGTPLSWEGILLPGEYLLSLRASVASAQPYALRVGRMDPFATAGDLEPNDTLGQARPFPATGVLSGHASSDGDVDVFRLPEVEKPTTARLTFTGELRYLQVDDAKGEHLDVRAQDEAKRRWTFPVGAHQPLHLVVAAEGDYSLGLALDGVPKRTDGVLPISLGLSRPAAPFAAWGPTGQRVALALVLKNPTGSAQTVSLRAWASHPDWHAQLPASVTVPAGGEAKVPLKVAVPPDLDANAVRVMVEAAAPSGARAVTGVDLSAGCGELPLNPGEGFTLPRSMKGGLNLAYEGFGASLVTKDDYERRKLGGLLSGLDTADKDAQLNPNGLMENVTVKLAGDAPVPVAGIVLRPPGNLDYDTLRDFDLLLSDDGARWQQVLSGTLQPTSRPQAFALKSPVQAHFARLHLKSAWRFRSPIVALAGLEVLSPAGTRPLQPKGGFNLADPALGGQVVWADAMLEAPRKMLDEKVEQLAFRRDPTQPTRWVLAFRELHAASIQRLEWVEAKDERGLHHLSQVRVLASLDSPFGPWTKVADWKLERDEQGVARLTLEKPLRARYLQFWSDEGADPEDWRLPDTLRVYEAEEADKPSALAELGPAGDVEGKAWVAPAHPSVLGTREKPKPLASGKEATDAVERQRDEDWYQLTVPEGHNALSLTVTAPDLARIGWHLETAGGKEVALRVDQKTAGHVRLSAQVSPGNYRLHVEEPIRSVVFAWDSSGSVADYRPLIYRALERFASEVKPGREQVQLLPFGGAPLAEGWGTDPLTLQQALQSYDERDGSSDSEGTLQLATAILGKAPGSRAVMLITDDDSGAATREENTLWRALDEVRPRVFSVQIPVGDRPQLFHDRMTAYAAVHDGHYETFHSRDDLDLAFARASCMLRRPATYRIGYQTRHEVPPAPGALSVRREGPAPKGTAFEIIFDASGSMMKRMGKQTRVGIAHAVLARLVKSALPAGTPVALRAFGHQRPRSCQTSLVVPLQPMKPDLMAKIIRGINPQDHSGTPLAASIKAVRDDLSGAGKHKVVVLVTDGEESCGGDPAAEIAVLKQAGFDVRLNIVGLALGEAGAQAGFERWAELGGGRFYPADDAKALTDALQKALNPPFQVLDGTSRVIATGTVNAGAVSLPPGEYRVRVLSTPPQTFDTIQVESAKERKLELRPRE